MHRAVTSHLQISSCRSKVLSSPSSGSLKHPLSLQASLPLPQGKREAKGQLMYSHEDRGLMSTRMNKRGFEAGGGLGRTVLSINIWHFIFKNHLTVQKTTGHIRGQVPHCPCRRGWTHSDSTARCVGQGIHLHGCLLS